MNKIYREMVEQAGSDYRKQVGEIADAAAAEAYDALRSDYKLVTGPDADAILAECGKAKPRVVEPPRPSVTH